MAMEKWMQEKLSELLKFSVQDDMIQCILQIENERDLDAHLQSLLDNENPHHKQFIIELKKKRASYNSQNRQKKTSNDDSAFKKQNDKKKVKGKGKKNQTQEAIKPEIKFEKTEKKKTKFVNLSHGDILLTGRHKCDCEARKHALVNNCINCGRIVCMQENSGPCFFCGNLVCSPKEQELIRSNTKQASNLYNKLMDQKPNKSLEESLKQRDKLLEFDRDCAHRTKVIDDESDYYQSNSIWLSSEERKKLQKQEEEIQARKHASRLNRKVTLDFTGREIIDEDQTINLQLEDLDQTMSYDGFENSNICPTLEFERPTFVEIGILERNKNHQIWNTESRIQDKEYLEMSDQGLCLSMHQPYASLLVAGIKIHEGRTWYSSHRGRLWIASAAKIPSLEEISTIEQTYRILKNENIKFPEIYPTSCLLGCVTVTDVLSQKEYRELYPEGESDSPYVFICENAYMLPIQFPIKGKFKIYKLDKKIHQAVSKCLEKVMKTNNN